MERHNLFEIPLLPAFFRADRRPIVTEWPAKLARDGNISTSIDVLPSSMTGKKGNGKYIGTKQEVPSTEEMIVVQLRDGSLVYAFA